MSRIPFDTAVAALVERMNLVLAPDQVVEVRSLGVPVGKGRGRVSSGFFDPQHRTEMARAALIATQTAAGVYYTINPVHPSLLSRAPNVMTCGLAGAATSAGDILSRRYIPVDCDPVKSDPKGSATADERQHALETARRVTEFLTSRGWSQPFFAPSGNGCHVLVPIDLPAEDGGIVQRVLQALAARFDTPGAKIDTAIHDANRILRMPLTMARKGENTPERPHRRAQLRQAPALWAPVPRELVEELASEVAPVTRVISLQPVVQPTSAVVATTGDYTSRLNVEKWLRDCGQSYRVKSVDNRGRTVYVLAACPFNSAHADPDSCIMQAHDGAMSAKCLHNSCNRYGWRDFKAQIGKPDRRHYEPSFSACHDDTPVTFDGPTTKLPQPVVPAEVPTCAPVQSDGARGLQSKAPGKRDIDCNPRATLSDRRYQLECPCHRGWPSFYKGSGKNSAARAVFAPPCKGWGCGDCSPAKRRQWAADLLPLVRACKSVGVHIGTKETWAALLERVRRTKSGSPRYASVLLGGDIRVFFVLDPARVVTGLRLRSPERVARLLEWAIFRFVVPEKGVVKQFKPITTSRKLIAPFEEPLVEKKWKRIGPLPKRSAQDPHEIDLDEDPAHEHVKLRFNAIERTAECARSAGLAVEVDHGLATANERPVKAISFSIPPDWSEERCQELDQSIMAGKWRLDPETPDGPPPES